MSETLKWLPIESAPKDGTWIVGGFFHFPGEHGYHQMFWNSLRGFWCDTHTQWSGKPHQSGPSHWIPDLVGPPDSERPDH